MDSKNTSKQIAIQLAIQFVGSLLAGVLLYQIFKPKDEDTNNAAARTTTTRTTVVEEQPLDDQQGA